MLDRLTQADRFEGGGAIAALVASLMPWYHFDDATDHVTVNAFGTGFCGDVVFLCAAAMLFVILVRRDIVTMRLDLSDTRIDGVIGGAALAACVLQLLVGVNGSGAFHSATIGVIVALAASACMAAGAWLRSGERTPARAGQRR
jgi:hypothetical protein